MPDYDEYDEEPAPPAQRQQHAGGVDRDKLRKITEAIQVGDTDEGTEALAEFVDHVAGRAERGLQERAVQARLKQENDEALQKFAKKYPDLGAKKHLADAAKSVLADEIITDLKAAGLTDQDIEPHRSNVGNLATVHGVARMKGLKGVRTPDELLSATGEFMTREFNIKPAQRSQREYVRGLRAERGLPDREQRAGQDGAADYTSSRKADDYGELEARLEYVRELRRQRGFPVTK